MMYFHKTFTMAYRGGVWRSTVPSQVQQQQQQQVHARAYVLIQWTASKPVCLTDCCESRPPLSARRQPVFLWGLAVPKVKKDIRPRTWIKVRAFSPHPHPCHSSQAQREYTPTTCIQVRLELQTSCRTSERPNPSCCENRRRPLSIIFELLTVLVVMLQLLKGLSWVGRSIISSLCAC